MEENFNEEEKVCLLIPKVKPSNEKYVVSVSFIILNIIQSILVMFLCSVSIYYFSMTNISYFLAVDVISLFIAVIILGFMLIVVGWAAALSNTGLPWVMFHICMIILLFIEILLSLATSDYTGLLNTISSTWELAEDSTKTIFQDDLQCCGLLNITDRASGICPNDRTVGCLFKLKDIFIIIRFLTSTAMFICFMFGVFIDMLACAIGFQPDVISIEEQMKEEVNNINFNDEDEYKKSLKI